MHVLLQDSQAIKSISKATLNKEDTMARNPKNTRMCSGCMARRDKTELICIYKSADGIIIGDASLKKQGRSVYLCRDVLCMEKSIKKKWFSRSLKCELPPDFYDDLRNYFNAL